MLGTILALCAPPALEASPLIDDLLNIFYRSVRYAIYKGRETRHMPCLQLLQDLMLDELKRKYSAGRLSKFINSANEQLAIVWFKLKMKKD